MQRNHSYKRFAEIIIPFCILFFCVNLSAQTNYTYTPQGSTVELADNSEQTITNDERTTLRNYYSTVYPRAIILDDMTYTYNCHAYAWHMKEGGETCWMPYPSYYMTDGSYTQVHSHNPHATKVFYANSISEAHSAVVSTNNMLISKWGYHFLMKHYPTDCPYPSTNIKYYKLSMEIEGDELIQLTTPLGNVTKTYSLSNVPNGATVDWTTTGRVSINNGQGTNTLQVSIRNSGTGVISAKVHCNTGLIVNIPFKKNIIASSAPIITDIELAQYGPDYILKAITNCPDGNFDWSVSGGNATLYDNPYSEDATFINSPNVYKAIQFNTTGIYTITAIGRNPTSTEEYVFSKEFTITNL